MNTTEMAEKINTGEITLLRQQLAAANAELSVLHETLNEVVFRACDGQSVPALPIVSEIVTERIRQIVGERFDAAHDDLHKHGELADAAACYATLATQQGAPCPDLWPWNIDWWKQQGQRRDLIKAAALIMAEIERLDRAQKNSGKAGA